MLYPPTKFPVVLLPAHPLHLSNCMCMHCPCDQPLTKSQNWCMGNLLQDTTISGSCVKLDLVIWISLSHEQRKSEPWMHHAHMAWYLRCAIFDTTASGLLVMHVVVNTHAHWSCTHTNTHTHTHARNRRTRVHTHAHAHTHTPAPLIITFKDTLLW